MHSSGLEARYLVSTVSVAILRSPCLSNNLSPGTMSSSSVSKTTGRENRVPSGILISFTTDLFRGTKVKVSYQNYARLLDHEATHRYSSSFMKPLRGEKPPLAWRRSKHDACPNKFGRLQKTKARRQNRATCYEWSRSGERVVVACV